MRIGERQNAIAETTLERSYRRAVTLLDAEELGGALTDELASLFDEVSPVDLRKSRYA